METLSEVMESLRQQGYTVNFIVSDSKVIDADSDSKFSADDLKVISMHRFEGMSNPEDNSILYALETKDGRKGLLVDAYGVDGSDITSELAKKLEK